MIRQISVFVENKKGRLAEITNVLKESEVDIRAVSISDTKEFGILRLIVNDPDKAEKALKEAGFTVTITKVIVIALEDNPGGLNSALNVFVDADISVDYMYAYISHTTRKAHVIMKVNDNEKAIQVLKENGFELSTDDEIC